VGVTDQGGHDDGGGQDVQRHDMSDRCIAAGEPSLAALVVNAKTGEPGRGWQDGDVAWHTEVQRVFRRWSG
jgi:hypothetical protein